MYALVDSAQMRLLDAQTIALGLPGRVLMESAGRGVVDRLWALHRAGLIDLRAGEAAVLVGPGNNGGDGSVVARYLHQAGVAVCLWLAADADKLRGDARDNLLLCQALGVPVRPAAEAAVVLARLTARDVIVDALLGTGLTRPAAGELGALIRAANRSAARRVAVDVPSGLDADRGVPAGAEDDEDAVLRADDTVTFGYAKLGLCSAPGFRYGGVLTVVDIGIPDALRRHHGVAARLLDGEVLAPLRARRDPEGHKGTHGHLLILAGSAGKTGAALLCSQGALAAGVGLCTVAAPRGVQEALQGRVLEAMTQAYDGALADEGAEWLALARGKRVVAVGPGMPTGDAARSALLRLLREGESKLVLDADALNQLSLGEIRAAAARRAVVLTPHPGEAARLLGTDSAAVQRDRLDAARRLGAQSGAIVLLKGARTLVVDGADPRRLSVCPSGSAALGSGGMGDVLTGVVAALLCSGLYPDAYEAACAAAWWHGRAGDVLLAERFPGAILQAGELPAALPRAVAADAA